MDNVRKTIAWATTNLQGHSGQPSSRSSRTSGSEPSTSRASRLLSFGRRTVQEATLNLISHTARIHNDDGGPNDPPPSTKTKSSNHHSSSNVGTRPQVRSHLEHSSLSRNERFNATRRGTCNRIPSHLGNQGPYPVDQDPRRRPDRFHQEHSTFKSSSKEISSRSFKSSSQ